MAPKKEHALRCSFCGKSQGEVKKLIAGPSVYICNECVGVCNEIIADDAAFEAARSAGFGPPAEPPAAAPEQEEGEAARDEYAGTFICPKCRGAFVLFPRPPGGGEA